MHWSVKSIADTVKEYVNWIRAVGADGGGGEKEGARFPQVLAD